MKSKIYYHRTDRKTGMPSRDLMMGYDYVKENNPSLLTAEAFKKNYQLVAVVDELDLAKLFVQYQGHVWSPEGEARELIRALGLTHTSMCVGDIVQQGNKYWYCDSCDWTEITLS